MANPWRSLTFSLRHAFNGSRLEKIITRQPKISAQVLDARAMKKRLQTDPFNPHIIQDLKNYIRIPLQNKQFKLAEDISLEELHINMSPSNLREISFWLFSAANTGKLSRYEMLILLKTMRRYHYEFDHRDTVFLKNFQDNLEGLEKDITFFPYLSFKDPAIFARFFNIKDLQEACRSYGNNWSITTKTGLFRYKLIILNGLINNLWSDQFRKEMYGIGKLMLKNIQNNQAKSLNRLVKMAMCSSRQDCIIEQRRETSTISNTEHKIDKYLKQLGYCFKAGPLINGFQVDFLFGDRIVLQYNGYTHYCINRPKELTNYCKYMYKRLEELGFYVNLIESEKWEGLQYKQKQMKYLIEKVELRVANLIQ